MPVAYTTNDKASNDYMIIIHGSLPKAKKLDRPIPDDDPMYKDIMDSVLQSILKRLPLGPMAEQYRIVCNVEARPDFGGCIEYDGYGDPVELEGRYRVWIALHMHKGFRDERNFLRTHMVGGLKGEIIDESTDLKMSASLELQFKSIRDHLKPYHHPGMKQLVCYLKHRGINRDICQRIFSFMELEGIQCISLNGVSEKFMVGAWSTIISKCPRYMNSGHGRMVHPMWRIFSELDDEWDTLKENSFIFEGDHWQIHSITHPCVNY